MKALDRINVLGVGVSAINMEQALAEIDRWVSARQPSYACICTVHGVMDCQRFDDLKQIFNRAGLVTPDGMPLVWLARAKHPHVSRVYGPDLMLAEFARSQSTGHRHYLYGGVDGTGERLAAAMRARFPGIEIVGVMEPPFATLDELASKDTAAVINAARPDVVWVGIGSPKQERWVARMRPHLEAPVLMPVGAAFDFHSGAVRQAPRWMMRGGLEWFYRLMTDPRRLWRRYLIDNPWFVWALAMQRLGIRRYEI